MTIMRTTGLVASTLIALGLLSAAACASSTRRSGLNSRLIRPAQHGSDTIPAPYDVGGRSDSLETVIGKIRELSARARPAPKRISGSTIESFDRQLAAALLALEAFPSGEAHRLVAGEYARLGVFDMAHKHYRAALALNSRDGLAYEGLARLWRDAHLPALALGEAQRAVYFAPAAPAARNTLGTVLQALGQNREAEHAYRIALLLEPGAAYALNNIGYLALLGGDTPTSIQRFREAIALDARLLAAKHNLALAYAVAGRMDLAKQTLLAAGPAARADYNLGIINLARGKVADATRDFEAACRADRALPSACERADALRVRLTSAEGGLE
jgi:Tfp pilus assembly protein PilF